MVRAIEGIYKDGKIELTETPVNIAESRVYVLFVPEPGVVALDEAKRLKAIESLFAEMNKGHHLGGGPHLKREELYDRGSRR